MAAPFIVFQTITAHSGTGAISVTRPAAGVGKAGDLELLFVESANQAVTTPTGFSILSNSPVSVGVAAAVDAVRVSIFYRFSLGETTAISIADPGDHVVAGLITLRGVDPVTPFGPTATCSSATAVTEFADVLSSAIDIKKDAMCFFALADNLDSTSTNAHEALLRGISYTKDTTTRHFRTTSGNGGGVLVSFGLSLLQCSVGAFSFNSTSARTFCGIAFSVNGTAHSGCIFSLTEKVKERHASSGGTTVPGQEISAASATAAVVGTSRATISVPRIAGLRTGDLELLFIEHSDSTAVFSEPNYLVSPPLGWNHIPRSPCFNGGVIVLTILYRVANGDTANISIVCPEDHILAYHGYVRNANLDGSIFTGGLGGDFSEAISGGNFSYDYREDMGFSGCYYKLYGNTPAKLVPSGSNIAVICAIANDLDSATLNQFVVTPSFKNANGDSFSTQSTPLNINFQTSSGNGGGINQYVQTAVVQPTDPDNAIAYSETDIWRVGFDYGINSAAISFCVQGKVGPQFAFSSPVSIEESLDVSLEIYSPDSERIVCPHIYAMSSLASGYQASSISVNLPIFRFDNTPVESPNEFIGDLDIVLVSMTTAYTADDVSISSTGWTKIAGPMGPLTPENIAIDGYLTVIFWRKHTVSTLETVTVSFPIYSESSPSAIRISVKGADDDYPIRSVTLGQSFAASSYKNILPVAGGNGYDETSWPYYDSVLCKAHGNLVIGIQGYDVYAYNPTISISPWTSLDNWGVFHVPALYVYPYYSDASRIWHGKRIFSGTTPGALNPSRLGRVELPAITIPNNDMSWSNSGVWLLIGSRPIPKEATAIVSHASSLTAVGIKSFTAFVFEGSVVSASGKKHAFNVLQINSLVQAVPLVRPGFTFSASLFYSLDYVATAIKSDYEGVGQPFVLQEVSSFVTSGYAFFESQGASRDAIVSLLSATQTFGSKRGSSSFFSSSPHQVSASGAVGRVRRAEFFAIESLDIFHLKSAFGSVIAPNAISLDLFHTKKTNNQYLLSLVAQVLSQGLLVDKFLYGDLVVVDLRAAPLGLEQSCVRLSPVVEVRRGEDLEFSATREGLEAPGRRRALDITGEQVRLLGKEIVCVREVFDESK